MLSSNRAGSAFNRLLDEAGEREHFALACMVKASEIGILGAALRRSHGLSAESEVLGRLSSRVRRAAFSLQMQSEETVPASYGPTKTAILTMRRLP